MSHRKFNDTQEQEIGELYQRGWSYPRLAERFGVKHHLISRIVHRQRIQPRHCGRYPVLHTPEQIGRAVALYQSGLSQQSIAEEFHVSQAWVGRVLRKQGVISRRTVRGIEHGNWKGGKTLSPGGYIEVRVCPESPYWQMANMMGYVLEHRLVMAQHLDRCLTPKETVHHRNGDKTDNRLDNLELRNGRHGTGVVLVCADCGSRNIITED